MATVIRSESKTHLYITKGLFLKSSILARVRVVNEEYEKKGQVWV